MDYSIHHDGPHRLHYTSVPLQPAFTVKVRYVHVGKMVPVEYGDIDHYLAPDADGNERFIECGTFQVHPDSVKY